MSWHFSRELVEEFSAENSSDGGQSAPSSGMNMLGRCSSPVKTTDVSNPSQYGTTFKLSTGSHGEELLMWYLGGFPARTSVSPERVQELPVKGLVCGNTWQELSVRFDLTSCSWRTHQLLWEEALPESSVILPRWGMMRHGVCWERIDAEANTKGIESGLLPTVTKELFSNWASAHQKIHQEGKRKSGVKIGSIFWWTMTEEFLRRGGVRTPGLIPDPLCGEMLMGWPEDWTELGGSGTDKFRKWLDSHGES